LIFSPLAIRGSIVAMRPYLPDNATVLKEWRAGPNKKIRIIMYSVPDPNQPIPDAPPHVDMRNFYFRDERMRYLGPNAELRRLEAERLAAGAATRREGRR